MPNMYARAALSVAVIVVDHRRRLATRRVVVVVVRSGSRARFPPRSRAYINRCAPRRIVCVLVPSVRDVASPRVLP